MRSCRLGLSLLAILFFGNLSVLRAQSAAVPPPAAANPEPASFERLDDLLTQEKVVDGARVLSAQAFAPAPLTAAQEEILRRAVGAGRRHLEMSDASVEERNASRQLVCLARAHFPEELPDPLGPDGQPAPPLRVGNMLSRVHRPELIAQIKPEYTPEAREKQVMGTVILEAVIDREGCVRTTRVLKGLPYGLDKSSIAAVKNWTFNPATLNGEPVKVYYVLTVNYQL
ncbi:MAG TPA: energy transducer TonB [Thermoanaerobaculia bacterium]|jgi:TonB family protein|nr:energy transducer TonB [Thermoanaerobaculia bacterium]